MKTTPRTDKRAVIDGLVARVKADLAAAIESQRRIVDEATHEESRPENDKDTRALESTYLARGLAQRVDELQTTLAKIAPLSRAEQPDGRPAEPGCIVVVEDEDGQITRYLLAPAGGGIKLDVDGDQVIVVTADAPVGRALLGKAVDDDFVLKTPKAKRELVVLDLY